MRHLTLLRSLLLACRRSINVNRTVSIDININLVGGTNLRAFSAGLPCRAVNMLIIQYKAVAIRRDDCQWQLVSTRICRVTRGYTKICIANVFGLISDELNNRQTGEEHDGGGEGRGDVYVGKDTTKYWHKCLSVLSIVYRVLVATNVDQFSYRSNRRTAELHISGVGNSGCFACCPLAWRHCVALQIVCSVNVNIMLRNSFQLGTTWHRTH